MISTSTQLPALLPHKTRVQLEIHCMGEDNVNEAAQVVNIIFHSSHARSFMYVCMSVRMYVCRPRVKSVFHTDTYFPISSKNYFFVI